MESNDRLGIACRSQVLVFTGPNLVQYCSNLALIWLGIPVSYLNMENPN